jgi:hypothetical protein
MKTAAFVLTALLVIPLVAPAQAPVGPGSIELGKIAPEVVKTPEFQLSSGPTKRTGRSLSWIEFEVGYEVKAEAIDELTFKFIAQIEKQLITGEVTYVNIAKGRDKFAVMYVSPKGIDRLTKGKALSNASIENVWVEVSRQGQILAKAGWKNTAVPNAPQVAGLLLNKNQTPFAPLFYDRYEEIKAGR